MNKGLTLIETLITIAISAAMLAALANLFAAFTSLYSFQQTAKEQGDATGTLIHDVEALALPADHILASHTFAEGSYSSGTNVLVLEVPALDTNGAVLPDHYDYAAFYLSGTSAYRLINADASSARHSGVTTLGTSVRSLTFSYDNPDVSQATQVAVDVVASSTYREQESVSHLAETLRLRNL